MSEQPEALRLAKALESRHATTVWNNSGEAANELRRLHALCEEMGEVLEAARMPLDLYNACGWPDRERVCSRVKTALAKWKELK